MTIAQTTDRPVVSILMLCHNEAVFVRRAIRSVLAQTIADPVEILLLDDASVDGSAAIVEAEVAAAARPDMTLRIIRSDENLGNAAAFVTALRAARGRHYHVLDCDDYWIDPEKLRTQVALLEAHPDLAGVAHRAIIRAETDGTESFHPQQDPAKAVLGFEDLVQGGIYFHTSAMLFRNSFYNPATDSVDLPPIFDDVRGDTIRLYVHASLGGIYYVPQTMSVYDDHRGGIWTALDWPGRRDLLRNLHTRLHDHGYLADMGSEKAAEFLAARLAEINAYAPTSLRPISLHPDQVASAPRQRLTAVSRISSVLDLEIQLSSLTAERKHEDALRLVYRFLAALSYDRNIARAARARRLTSFEIDWHCANIGTRIGEALKILPPPCDAAAAAEGPVVILVSGVTDDREGLWDQTRDMIAFWRDRRRIVLMSTELRRTVPDIQDRVGADVELLLNTDQLLVEKAAWVMWHLARLKPSQVLVNPARNDVAIAAGLRPEHAPAIHRLAPRDGGFAIGIHSPAVTGFVARRPHDIAALHLLAPGREIVHLPLLAPGALPDAPPPPSTDGSVPLVTATAGQARDGFEAAYDYGLDVVVPALLARGVRRHVHFGDLSDAMVNRIRKALLRRGLPPEGFVHEAWPGGTAADPAAGLGAALRETGVSVFFQGFPYPETGPVMAALAAGLPVVAHRSYLHPMLLLADLCPEGAPVWATPEELAAILHAISPEWIAAHAERVRAHAAPLASAETVMAVRGADPMQPVAPEAIPVLAVPDSRDELRRLMSELTSMTIFTA